MDLQSPIFFFKFYLKIPKIPGVRAHPSPGKRGQKTGRVHSLKTNKNYKDTIFLKCIGCRLGLVLLPVTSVLGAGKNMRETTANTIFHGLEHRNPSFEKIYVEKLTKNPIWRGSGSGPNSSTSRPRIEKSGRTPGRQIVLSLYSNFSSLAL
jgi:hypothetical protein